MNARELKPCPFCQEGDDFGIGRGTEDREGFPTYIYCGECGAQGPWFYTRDKVNFTSTLMCAENSGWNTRAALPEQPLAEKWREEARERRDDAELAYEGRMYVTAGVLRGGVEALDSCADDLDSHESESRELLRRIVIAADSFNGTRPDMSFEAHVHALGELMKAVDEARKHLGGDSDGN